MVADFNPGALEKRISGVSDEAKDLGYEVMKTYMSHMETREKNGKPNFDHNPKDAKKLAGNTMPAGTLNPPWARRISEAAFPPTCDNSGSLGPSNGMYIEFLRVCWFSQTPVEWWVESAAHPSRLGFV